jgi:hypothetical protein
MRRRIVRYLLLSVLLAALPAIADDSAAIRADELMAVLKSGNFEQAAIAFHYPETYTPAELVADRKSVADGLRKFFQEIGDIQTFSRVSAPSGAFLTFTQGGGDIPYWSSHPTLNSGEKITYRAHVRREGDIYFVVALVHPQPGWDVRTFGLELPASAQSATRLREIASKVMQSTSNGTAKGA